MRRRNQRGLTLVELIVAFSIMLLLTTMAVPLARAKVRRDRERDLRYALDTLRKAIDKYNDYATAGLIPPGKVDSEKYPETLTQLACAAPRTTRPVTVGAARMYSMSSPRPWRKRRMERTTRIGSRRGFTMIELMIVMAIVVILVSIAVPMYQKAILRAKESVLKNNLFTIRTVIDEYTYDKQKAPQTLQDLVSAGYLREIPIDPMTGKTEWRTIMEDPMAGVSQMEPGLFDVKSLSEGKSLDGTQYSDW
jgi:general secretion pathway protein G